MLPLTLTNSFARDIRPLEEGAGGMVGRVFGSHGEVSNGLAQEGHDQEDRRLLEIVSGGFTITDLADLRLWLPSDKNAILADLGISEQR